MLNAPFDWKLPYRWRTNLRAMLPWALVWLFNKGKDCEEAGASHEWYNIDNESSGCYHCREQRDGQLWNKTERE
jgi:hypothetical protein